MNFNFSDSQHLYINRKIEVVNRNLGNQINFLCKETNILGQYLVIDKPR